MNACRRKGETGKGVKIPDMGLLYDMVDIYYMIWLDMVKPK